ncbi:MAG: caspase family protein [Rhizobiaceae bacterium]|nr:caspase family protein [Rhizobiaceae bacterium]
MSKAIATYLVVATLALLMLTATGRAADALHGVALVIGQSDYEHVSRLPNPENDARAIEDLLNDLGFETSLAENRDLRRLRRDLDRFVEDAEEANVAVLYYSGHGIEAGGQNFLVPVDADTSSLDNAEDALIPVIDILNRLKETVPVTIVILDACRDNPFPTAATLRVEPEAPAQPITAGLSPTRGAAPLVSSQTKSPGLETLGEILAFAAEPGKVALDGEPGGNSPYATALLRHLSALSGEEFGTVMRMVTEEVYLKTNGRQRPWVNESLRRLLYFGRSVASPGGDEGDMLAERRQLLLTIADLPNMRRRQVEQAAVQGGVPMDAVYGMLRALGSTVPDDPAELDELLGSEARRFAKILAERNAINSPDPEIVSLSALADTAEREGLLAKASELRDRAKARVRQLEPTLEQQEQALRQRFIESAEVFARSAETSTLANDNLAAAHDFAEAARRVDGRDSRLAWRYANAEIKALTTHGDYRGDNEALEQAIAKSGKVLELAETLGDRDVRAITHNTLGNALTVAGKRASDPTRLHEAVTAYRAAIDEWSPRTHPLDWATAQSNLGIALRLLGERDGGTELLDAAAEAMRAALEVRTRERQPLGWAESQNNLGNVLLTLGQRQGDVDKLSASITAYRAALEEWSPQNSPFAWATSQNNLGIALMSLGFQENDADRLKEALVAFDAALTIRTHEQAPLDWARTLSNRGQALHALGTLQDGNAMLEQAAASFQQALSEITREKVPLEWALTKNNLGVTLQAIGTRQNAIDPLTQAADTYREALEIRTEENVPLEWATTQSNLGVTLGLLGQLSGDRTQLEESAAALRAALTQRTRDRSPHLWAATQKNLGIALLRLGLLNGGTDPLEEAADALRSSLLEFRPKDARQDWLESNSLLALALKTLGERTDGERSAHYLEEAVGALRDAQSAISRSDQTALWADTQNDIGFYLSQLGDKRQDLTLLEESETILREALSVQTELQSRSAAYTADSLCGALRSIGALKRSHAILLEARDMCARSLAALTAAGDPNAAIAEKHLHSAEDAIEALE